MDLIPEPDQARPEAKARELRFEIVPRGHLGMLTGRAARRTIIDEFLADWADAAGPTSSPIGSDPTRRYGSASSRSLAAKKG